MPSSSWACPARLVQQPVHPRESPAPNEAKRPTRAGDQTNPIVRSAEQSQTRQGGMPSSSSRATCMTAEAISHGHEDVTMPPIRREIPAPNEAKHSAVDGTKPIVGGGEEARTERSQIRWESVQSMRSRGHRPNSLSSQEISGQAPRSRSGLSRAGRGGRQWQRPRGLFRAGW
jgi:hypothetical protein